MSSSSWRTSIALVQGICITDPILVGVDGLGLTPFIDAANGLVTAVCAIPIPQNHPLQGMPPYTVDWLTQIETWLSAHFYTILDPQAASEAAGGVSTGYWGSVGLDLRQTRYGEQAIILDYFNFLGALQKRATDGTVPRPGIISLASRRRRGFGGPC